MLPKIDSKIISAFNMRFIQSPGCWIWIAYTGPEGYGVFRQKAGSWLAHRLAYKINFGEFDEELKVCHSCDNPPCVNPSHLWLGTDQDNRTDSVLKGRNFSILNKFQVLEIRAKFIGGYSLDELAIKYKVSKATISRIVNRLIWNHI